MCISQWLLVYKFLYLGGFESKSYRPLASASLVCDSKTNRYRTDDMTASSLLDKSLFGTYN